MIFDVFQIGQSGTLLKYYAILLIIIAVFCLKIQNVTIDKLFLCEFCFLFLCLFSVFYSINFSASLSTFITLMLNFGMIIICKTVPCSDDELKFLKKALFVGSFVVIITTFMLCDYSDNGRLTISILGYVADQNYLNGYALFAFGMIVYSLITYKKHRLVKLIGCLGVIYFTLMTGSRGALLAEIGVFFAVILINAVRSKKSIKFIATGIILSLLFLMVFSFLLSYVSQEVAERFSFAFIQEQGTSSRMEIWTALLERFFGDNPLSIMFGHGIGTSAYYNTFDFHVAHNAFIDILIGTGIIGLLTYIAIFLLMLKKAWISENFSMFAILIGFIVLSMSLSLITYKPIFNCFLFIEIYYQAYRRKEKNEVRVIKGSAEKAN